MLTDFDNLIAFKAENMNGGVGEIISKMYNEPMVRIILTRIPKGGSIGVHEQSTSSDINYFISGRGETTCNGETEVLRTGVCHYCPKGSTHSIRNSGDEDLVLFTVVPQQ